LKYPVRNEIGECTLKRVKPVWLFGLALLVGGVAWAAFYLQPVPDGNARACIGGKDVLSGIARASVGEVAGFQVLKAPGPLPDLHFATSDGSPRSLADFRGKVVLLNLWATWCAPCRKEMPALDLLQTTFGGSKFEVVAINIDTRDPEKPREWLRDNKIANLAYYADPQTKVFQELKRVGQAVGMPTTLLIDAQGCRLGVLHGAAEWASEDAKALIKAAIDAK
jgi:thiol-disulfide isomerase/thioredoxin